MFDVNLEKGRIRAYGAVGDPEEGFTDQDFLLAFDALDGADVVIELNSPGGDVFAGQSIENQIQGYHGRVEVRVDALSASIASAMMMAADRITANENSTVMVHNPWTIAMGDANEFRTNADILDMLAGNIAKSYAAKTGKPAQYWLDVMDQSPYMTAAEALSEGLIDEVVGSGTKTRKAAAVVARPAVTASATPRLDRVNAKRQFMSVLVDRAIRGR